MSEIEGLGRKLQWADFYEKKTKELPGGIPPVEDGVFIFAHVQVFFQILPDPFQTEYIEKTKQYRLKDNIKATVELDPNRKLTWKAFAGTTSGSSRPGVFTKLGQSQLLAHEQGHYDLFALIVRDGYNELMKLKEKTFGTSDEVTNAAKKLVEDVKKELVIVNERYDKETIHGTKIGMQKYWEGKFSKAYNPKTPVPLAPLIRSHAPRH